ncbi:ribonuclease H-like protein [Pisolithus marmoratus]|nr:ribonuclease H-like protein [Pisolithus marmoratus]
MSSDDGRLFTPCPGLTAELDTAQLIRTCKNKNSGCGGRFFAACCSHRGKVCHHYLIVFTDGACFNNGRYGAVSGIGIAFGTREENSEDEDQGTHQFAIPVDDRLDPEGKRTSQRAELLAALHGLKRVCDEDESHLADLAAKRCRNQSSHSQQPEIIVTTDSEYVVKGMTEWLPTWKENNMRKANGQRPSNIDLFLSLDAEVNSREREHDCKIKFWHIDREFNTIADELAKRGAHTAGDGINYLFVHNPD